MPQKKRNGAPRRWHPPQKKKERYYTLHDIRSGWDLPEKTIRAFFPEPAVHTLRDGSARPCWTGTQVREALKHPRVAEAVREQQRRRLEDARLGEEIREYLTGFGIDQLRRRAERLPRRFVLHIGPTNSGKTYQSIQALEKAESGAYLGPLRLLALEMYDRLNRAGTPCSLLTGEESVPEEGARHVASTIELANYSAQYEVAVIDEAQMIADPFRGDRWMRAIFLIQAKEVHLCLAPEAESLIRGLLESFSAPYEIIRHERLAPLRYAGPFESIRDAKPGDALIVFSRKAVLAVAAELANRGVKSSVIYGALPPVSRREEVRRFTGGESTVVVATDAIGMGISLPIRRVVFCETSKFDGRGRRKLRSGEIKQVAGRAGRYGIFDRGEVLSMTDFETVEWALTCPEKQLERLTVPFPEETLDSAYPLSRLLQEWNALPREPGFSRVDMSDALLLFSALPPKLAKWPDRRLLFRLITCPVDTKDEDMIRYWLACARAILSNQILPEPPSGTGTLEECEARYKELDVRHQMLRQIGIEEDRMDEKLALCEAINKFLKENKDEYLRRCRDCGRPLPATHPYGVCDRCFRKAQRGW